jgi:addiction module HigA family antidote
MKNPPHPGQVVRRAIMEDLRLTITAAAEGLGVSRKQLTQIVNAHAGISPEMAIRLEKGVGSTAGAWLRMQAAYDLAQAQKASTIRIKKLQPA